MSACAVVSCTLCFDALLLDAAFPVFLAGFACALLLSFGVNILFLILLVLLIRLLVGLFSGWC